MEIPRPRSASMSSRTSSRASQRSQRSDRGIRIDPALTPAHDRIFDACAATAAFFLYAQRNIIMCLHHDTLAIERRFTGHSEDVVWIEVDNFSETGAGRMVASYDAKMMTIIWDLLTGRTIARLEPYGDIRVAAWMRNGTIAFGNSQGNITLFEPNTKENISVRTIYTPITALAPSIDCRTFSIGYLNGTILIACLQPNFTILHTLNTRRPPSPINCLGWHGSSRSDMLASQTMDGDLRVWSIPRGPNGDPPAVIRHFDQGDIRPVSGPCWFAWSKAGRIVQYSDGITTSWDVRTKRVTYESVPTIEGVVGIANYGPHAVLFTVGRNHTVQQYDLNPETTPALIQEVQHVPAVVPPSPPFSDVEHGNILATAGSMSRHQKQQELISSEDDSDFKSPLHRIVLDVDVHPGEGGEGRDILAPLSPVSSRSSTRSSHAGQSKRKLPVYPNRYERSQSAKLRPKSPGMRSTMSSTPSTIFSSGSSNTSSRRVASRLRQEVLMSPDDSESRKATDLFPFIKARLTEVQFKPPRYPEGSRTPDYLRQEMLRCVFGWDGEVDELIRWELSHHDPGSAAAVLLSKWIGDLGANMASSMVGSESMTSSDWMLLALSAVEGDSQRKVGDVFVQRLLEKGDVHPAAAILLGLGENIEAIEVYVSRGYYLEAVLLVCLLTPNDWQRISHLARQWGEVAISNKQSELAVRCFACTGVESSEPWFSPAAKDAIYQAQMRIMGPDGSPNSNSTPNLTPTDPLSAGPSKKSAQAGLKLITDFTAMSAKAGNMAEDRTPMLGMTPMDTSLSPSTALHGRWTREPMSSITATPGGLTSRRVGSRDRSRDQFPGRTPISTIRSRQEDHLYAPKTATKTARGLPSPAESAFSSSKAVARLRNGSRDRKPDNLHVDISDVFVDPSLPSSITMSTERTQELSPAVLRLGAPSPASMSDASARQKIRGIDEYISSLGEATVHKEQKRGESSSREQRNMSRGRATSDSGKRYIRPAKRSPSSPVSMSPEDPALKMAFASVKAAALAETKKDESSDAENFYRVASPISANPGIDSIASPVSTGRGRTSSFSQVRSSSKAGRMTEPNDRDGRGASRSRPPTGRAESRARSPERESGRRGRSRPVDSVTARRSPESPISMSVGAQEEPGRKPRDQSIGARVRARGSSANRTANRETSPDRVRQRERSLSARPRDVEIRAESPPRTQSRTASRSRKPSVPKLQTNFSDPTIGTRKSQAAKDLEARRRSLARRPSAPVIVHPKDLGSPGSTGAPRLDFIPTEQDLIHGHSGDAEPMVHVGSTATGTSTSSVPIGLPSNPRAMRHTKYMSAEPDEDDNMQSMAYISSTIQRPPTTEPALLPAMVFVPPSRAASAPLEKMLAPNAPRHISRESLNTRPIHSRMSSLNEMIIEPSPPPPPPPPPGPFIDRNSGLAVLDSSVVIVQDRDSTDLGGTVILPELQHLANAGGSVMGNHPPSNSSSTSLGVINIGISTPEPMTLNAQHLPASVLPAQPPPMEMSSTPSHRRGHGSVGGNIADTAATHGGIGGKLRGVRDRLRDRSASRNRTKSPPRFTHSPYESISGPMEPRSKSVQPILTTQQYVSSSGSTTNLTLPSVAYNAPGPTLTQATYNPNAPNPSNLPSTTTGYRTPKEIARAVMQQSAANAPPVPPVPPLPPGPTEHLQFGINAERTAPQGGLPSNMAGYRNPKDIRANMPPNSLQPGTGPRQTLNGEPF